MFSNPKKILFSQIKLFVAQIKHSQLIYAPWDMYPEWSQI